MNEQIQLLRSYVRIIWPYRWLALFTAGAICFFGWGYAFLLPNQYEVRAKIFIDTRSMLRPLLEGLAVDNRVLEDSALMMRQTLLTRPNLEEVARRTDLDLTVKSPKEFDALILALAQTLTVTGSARDNIYEITYENADPKLAKRVVDELLNTFLEAALGDTRKDTAVTQKFLDEQISEYERKLIEAEERLKEFKRKNLAVMPGTGEDYYASLKSVGMQLQQAKLDLEEAVQRRDELARQIAGEEPVFGIVSGAAHSSPAIRQIDSRIDILKKKLDDLLLSYTDKHPDVVAIQATIAKLEEERQVEEGKAVEIAGEGGLSPLDQNPIYQEMKIQLASYEGEVAALSGRVKEYENRAAQLKKLVDTVPEVEAELKRLDRDYGLNKRQYDELIKRRESARMSEQADKTGDDIKVKVIDPPRVPLVPTGPDRISIVSMVLAASLGAGAALAFLMSQIFPRFFTTDSLKEYTGIAILGTVSLVQNPKQISERRMELALFGLVFMCLLGVYGGLIALHLMQIDLHTRVASLLSTAA